MLAAAVNDLCNGGHMDDPEFQTRLGFDREALDALGDELYAALHAKP
jgi:hypothetical protein